MIGQTLGHYRIVERIGVGGMGVVYRANDQHLERDVALTILPTDFVADQAARKRFRREALALSKLNHPNIPQSSTSIHVRQRALNRLDSSDGKRRVADLLRNQQNSESEIENLQTPLASDHQISGL
jgi:serine/threonine protein kinase